MGRRRRRRALCRPQRVPGWGRGVSIGVGAPQDTKIHQKNYIYIYLYIYIFYIYIYIWLCAIIPPQPMVRKVVRYAWCQDWLCILW